MTDDSPDSVLQLRETHYGGPCPECGARTLTYEHRWYAPAKRVIGHMGGVSCVISRTGWVTITGDFGWQWNTGANNPVRMP